MFIHTCNAPPPPTRTRRKHRIFSIDPPTAKDLDDALSIEPLPNGNLRVGVHIGATGSTCMHAFFID